MILGIYGSGGLGREVLDLTPAINTSGKEWEDIVFIDDFTEQSFINGTRVMSFDDFLKHFSFEQAKVVIATGEPEIRQVLRERVASNGYSLQSLVHPTAFIGSGTTIGSGAIIQFGSFVSCNVRIEDNALIQPNASVGHDSVIGFDTVISSYVAISGACRIGDKTYIGVSTPVKENISIGSEAIVGMGSVVLRDIPGGVIALGNPARPIKKNDSHRVFRQRGEN